VILSWEQTKKKLFFLGDEWRSALDVISLPRLILMGTQQEANDFLFLLVCETIFVLSMETPRHGLACRGNWVNRAIAAIENLFGSNGAWTF